MAFTRPTTSANGSVDWMGYLRRLANLFGTPNVSTTTYLCQWHRNVGSKYTYGTGMPEPDCEHTRAIVVVGHNPAVTNPQLFKRLLSAQRRGATLAVVDPRRSETAERADLWLAPRYGSDAALFMGAIRFLLESGRFDTEFVRAWTNGPFLVDTSTGRFLRPSDGNAGFGNDSSFAVLNDDGNIEQLNSRLSLEAQEISPVLFGELGRGSPNDVPSDLGSTSAATALSLLRAQAADFTLHRVASETGLDQTSIERFYDLVAQPEPFAYVTWNGLEQHENAFYTNRALCTLYALTGGFDAQGGNILLPSPEEPELDGRAHLQTAQLRKRLGTERWPLGAPATAPPAYTIYDAILDGIPYPVRGLVSFGSNMLLQNPDSERGREALRSLEFHAHIDLFPTPMSSSADLLLPAAAFWESPGLRAGFGGSRDTATHVQYRPPAAAPPGEARPDVEILFDLACRLGYAEHFWDGDVQKSYAERAATLGTTLENLKTHHQGITLQIPMRHDKHQDTETRSGEVKGFATPTGRVEIYSERLLEHGYWPFPAFRKPTSSPAFNPDIAKKEPLVLSTIKLRFLVQSQHRGLPSARRRWAEPFVEVHPRTAEAHDVVDGQWVAVEVGERSIHVAVRVTDRVQPGAVVGQAGWWEGCAELGLPSYDPFRDEGANVNRLLPYDSPGEVSGGIGLKSYHCRLRKLETTRHPPDAGPG